MLPFSEGPPDSQRPIYRRGKYTLLIACNICARDTRFSACFARSF